MTLTTLASALNATDTVMTVASATGFTAGSTIALIDNEVVAVNAVSGTTITITRGQNQTAPTTHGNGRAVAVGSSAEFTNMGGFVDSFGSANPPLFNTLAQPLVYPVTQGTGNATLTAGAIANGLILTDSTGNQTLTTPTAALLLAAFPRASVGSTARVHIRNTGTGTTTIGAGAGCTISGTATIATLNCKDFLVRWTSVTAGSEAYTLYSYGTSVF